MERFEVTSKRTRAEEIDFLPLKCLDNYGSTIRMTAAENLPRERRPGRRTVRTHRSRLPLRWLQH